MKKLGTYDFVVDVDSVEKIGSAGWNMTCKDETTIRRLIEGSDVKVSIVGMYNRGKTFLLNELTGGELRTGCVAHTVGLSIIAPSDDLVFLDTAGQNQPVAADDGAIRDRLLSEQFLRDLVVEVSDVIIVVVNQLTLNDQQFLKTLHKMEQKSHTRKSIIVVHNFRDILDMDAVDVLIKKEMLNCAKAKQEVNFESKMKWWREPLTNFQHIVMASAGSDAGNAYNANAIAHINNFLHNKKTELNAERLGTSLLQSFFQYTAKVLPAYFDFQSSENPLLLKKFHGADGPFLKLTDSGGQSLNEAPKYKKHVHVIEYELSMSDANPYELHWRIFRQEAKTVVIVDVPGLFIGGDPESDNVKKTVKRGKTSMRHYCWRENDVEVLTVEVRLFHQGTKTSGGPLPPEVKIISTRRPLALEASTLTTRGSRQSGKAVLRVPLDDGSEDAPTFADADARLNKNGVLQVTLEHESAEDEEWTEEVVVEHKG